VHLRFDEALIPAQPTDSLATALLAASELMTSRSPKYRRPRGAYCLSGDCGTCLVRVDGRPNVRACMTPAREGLRASSQNTYAPKRLDPTALVDSVFPGGIDHHHLMVRPRLLNQIMQELARNLTGFGELPEGVSERAREHVVRELPVVIVGAGSAGRSAAAVLERAGIEHLLVDRHALVQLQANADAALPSSSLLSETGVFGIYPGPRQAFDPHDRALLAACELTAAHERLHELRPQHLLLCTGAREPMLPFANNDLPGIVAARGLIRALRRAEARIAGACVVVGEGPWAERCRDELDALRSGDAPRVHLVAPEQIERAVGHDRIESLHCRNGRLTCALLAVAGPLAPAHELASQAGVALRFESGGFAVARESSGRCGRLGGTTLWAAGDVCGWQAAGDPARDGERVAQAIVQEVSA
jgi:sarcosine oxidase subunit alpha